MFKQIILPILGVIVFIIVVGIFVQKSSSLSLLSPQPTSIPTKTITVGSTKVDAQIAGTADRRAKGLSGVTSLKENGGMLFVFDTKSVIPAFWMKDMLIPLDIIWIGSGRVVRIDKNVPVPTPGTADNSLRTYSPGQPIDYVLEVGAGFSDKNKIKVGDTIILPTL